MPHREAASKLCYALFGGSVILGSVDSANATALAAGVSALAIALTTAAVYAINNLGPAWLKYRKDRDEMLSRTLGGQLAALRETLQDTNAKLAAKDDLIETHLARIDSQADVIEELRDTIRMLRERTHTLAGEVNNVKLNAMLDHEKIGETRRAVNTQSKAITELAEAAGHVTIAPALIETNAEMATLRDPKPEGPTP